MKWDLIAKICTRGVLLHQAGFAQVACPPIVVVARFIGNVKVKSFDSCSWRRVATATWLGDEIVRQGSRAKGALERQTHSINLVTSPSKKVHTLIFAIVGFSFTLKTTNAGTIRICCYECSQHHHQGIESFEKLQNSDKATKFYLTTVVVSLFFYTCTIVDYSWSGVDSGVDGQVGNKDENSFSW